MSDVRAYEISGVMDDSRHVRLDEELPIPRESRVRVIVLYSVTDEWDESEWLQAAARNPAFAYLNHPAEDIYTIADGRPVYHEE